jgi:putative RecB family exonuclease
LLWVWVPTHRIVAEGRVDRIDRRGDRHVVIDYKTGRRTPTPDDAAASQALALYAVAVERTLRRPCTEVELHHLPTGTVAAWQHDRTSLRDHVQRAERLAAELDAAGAELAAGRDPDALFPARPGPRCGSCEVRRHCAPGRAAAPEEAPWAQLAP